MILNVSGKTDIVAFYSEQFMNRYKVDLSILNHLKEIDKSVIFQATYNAI